MKTELGNSYEEEKLVVEDLKYVCKALLEETENDDIHYWDLLREIIHERLILIRERIKKLTIK